MSDLITRTDAMMRATDPAAGLEADPTSTPALALMAEILAEPRPSRWKRWATRPSRPVRRVVAGGLLGAGALTIALAAPLPWRGDGSGLGSAAYAVTVGHDGSTRVVMRWSELSDPIALQQALDRAGAHVRILTGAVVTTGRRRAVPACAEPTSGVGYSSRAVQWDFPNSATDVNGIVIRPAYFPAHGTLVIEVFYRPGRAAPESLLSYLVVGAAPTCVQPVYSTPLAG